MSSQDWVEKDFYQALGISKGADEKEIKKAYRKLAREFHPDANAGDAKAEARFKEISEAYAVLSDEKKKAEYDQLRDLLAQGHNPFAGAGAGGAGGNFQGGFSFEDLFGAAGQQHGGFSSGGQQFGGQGGNFQDIFSGMFRQQRNQPRSGADLEFETTLDFLDAMRGAQLSLQVGSRKIQARIPAGVKDGQRIRLAGKGEPGQHGGSAGDLYLRITVKPDPVFTAKGKNVALTVPVTYPEAALGGTVTVPTIEGDSVTLRLPAGTKNGRTFRAKGKGAQHLNGSRGDMLVTVEVAVPAQLSKAAKQALQEYADAAVDHHPREHLDQMIETEG